MSKHKINPSNKIDAVQRIMEGSEGLCQAARRLNVSPTSVKQWMSIYNSDGIDGFHSTGNKKYSKELKEQAVLDYLAGKGSQQSISVSDMESNQKASCNCGLRSIMVMMN